MGKTVTLDSGGRILIPSRVREELRLSPGDKLRLESDGEQVSLKPVRGQTTMRKEHGVWVFRSGQRIAAAETEAALADLRASRTSGRTKG